MSHVPLGQQNRLLAFLLTAVRSGQFATGSHINVIYNKLSSGTALDILKTDAEILHQIHRSKLTARRNREGNILIFRYCPGSNDVIGIVSHTVINVVVLKNCPWSFPCICHTPHSFQPNLEIVRRRGLIHKGEEIVCVFEGHSVAILCCL